MTMDADGLRSAFTRYFVERGHTALPAAGLIPHDPSVLFTIAGMVQFKPYFTGEQAPPVPRATTIQPVFRTVDIELIGTDARHNTFFEMLGNFSFGDYFKEKAIPFAWGLVTDVLGFDPDKLWITVHESDDDAAGIWEASAAVAPERIQRMGEDNFWRMGTTGPCGPCSEIYYDKGPNFGAPGGPARGGEERFVEIWNLVFMQYEQEPDGSLSELPKKSIDTGAGLERILTLVEGVDTIFQTDVMAPIVETAARLTGAVPGSSERADTALQILADHARAMTFLVSDGVFPSNDGRGYVLRRMIRRAVLRAHQLGVTDLVTPELVSSVTSVMGNAYPKLERDCSLVQTVVGHEEEAFRRTLRAGSALLSEELSRGRKQLPGDLAFRLHDTFGFPVDLTVELAGEQGVTVDLEGFDEAMAAQRDRARRAGAGAAERRDAATGVAAWRSVIDSFGPTRFVGYQATTAEGRVLAVEARPNDETSRVVGHEEIPADSTIVDLVLDTTPFYAEGGGQVGDTGTIEGPEGRMRVVDTTRLLDALTIHTGYFVEGTINAGEEIGAAVDGARRDALRRNHTGTHLLHWALRTVLGEHVKQQGSLVAPDRLRFDFSHFAPLTTEELMRVDELVNDAILRDEPVRVYETSKVEAERSGAMAFFGDKYGDVVRVVEAGASSVELCGGTHVRALGMIGPLRVLSETSIGANTRRIEAVTGSVALEAVRASEQLASRVAEALRTTPSEVPAALQRLLDREGELEEELRQLRRSGLRDEASRIAGAGEARIVARRDGLDPSELRELALAIRDVPGVEAVALAGIAGEQRVAVVVASRKDTGVDARAAVASAAVAVGGGGGGSPELATAGGRDVSGIEAALELLRSSLSAV